MGFTGYGYEETGRASEGRYDPGLSLQWGGVWSGVSDLSTLIKDQLWMNMQPSYLPLQLDECLACAPKEVLKGTHPSDTQSLEYVT